MNKENKGQVRSSAGKNKSSCTGCFGFICGSKTNKQITQPKKITENKPPLQTQQIQNNRGQEIEFQRRESRENVISNSQRQSIFEQDPRRAEEQKNDQNQQNQQKRKIAIQKFIKSKFATKDKIKLIKSVDERPNDREERKLYQYLCPICFKYYNEILNCTECLNYICIFCVRGVIRQQLKKTPKNGNMMPDVFITCPHCQKTDNNVMFEDIDKTKPKKVYTDSPTGTLRMSFDGFGGFGAFLHQEEEIKINPSHSKNASSIAKSGIRLQIPPIQQFNHRASSKSLIRNFISKAHLEVLKCEDLEDQVNSKRISDILCSPPKNQQFNFNFQFETQQSHGNHHQSRDKYVLSRASLESPYPKPMINTYVKEHFWTYEFLKTLNQRKSQKSNICGMSKTFEDLQPYALQEQMIVKPQNMHVGRGSVYDGHANSNFFSPQKSNGSAQKPPRPLMKKFTDNVQGNESVRTDNQQIMSHNIKEFNSPKVLVLSNRDGSVFDSSLTDSAQKENGEIIKSQVKTYNQIANGVIKIGELLQQKRFFELNFQAVEEERFDQGGDSQFIELQDDKVQTPTKKEFSKIRDFDVRDSLMYSCDANEEAEEGEIIKGKVNISVRKMNSVHRQKDDSLERDTDEGFNVQPCGLLEEEAMLEGLINNSFSSVAKQKGQYFDYQQKKDYIGAMNEDLLENVQYQQQ